MASGRRPALITTSPLVDGEELGAGRKAPPDTPWTPTLVTVRPACLGLWSLVPFLPRQPYLQLLLRLLGDH